VTTKTLACLLLVAAWNATAQITKDHHSQADISCNECHDCELPTYKHPCLTLFPDFKRTGVTLDAAATEVPALITIDRLQQDYQPSVFTHQLHAEMAEMSGGCSMCHHHSSDGVIRGCDQCHGQVNQGLNHPGLRGAYHRQCLACHREWSGANSCLVCHERVDQPLLDKGDLAAKVHEPLEIPGTLVYKTEEEDGPLVTFHHQDHTQVFDLACTQCHRDDRCQRCHGDKDDQALPEREAHDACVACHESAIDDRCEDCHADQQQPRFDHVSKGWPLNRFHVELKCSLCHRDHVFEPLSKACLDCHRVWTSGVFDHAVTGLLLDDDHVENDCIDCHQDDQFATATCSECHDEVAYPQDLPGTRLKP